MFQRTTATQKLQKLNKRIRGIAGGTSASKTISILLLLIQYAQTQENKTVSIVSESMPHLKKGAMRDFLNIMQSHNYYNDRLWNRTDSTYKFETGTIIEFFSVESWEKVKGARRDVLFINEANHITYNAYTQMEVRTKEVIWLDWNPENEFWWYEEVEPNQDVEKDFVTLTYKDNEALDERIVGSIESRKSNKNWWRVYGLGLLGEVENRIYTGWKIIDEMPHEARLYRRGLDFGYSNDPTAIVDIYQYDGGYIFDELLYELGLKNREIAERLKAEEMVLTIADSAEPKSIDEIKDYGYKNIVPSQKGQGSVLQGINFVQDQRISVTKQSTNIIKEYRNYLWMKDKEENIINEPQDFLNHTMDAVRYGLDPLQKRGEYQSQDTGGVKPYIPGVG
jgi:phage terminase large subunit|tara:strand:+ start:4038 stop:5219 length:1182 start_codon:yes stop_codon:yes gene_type:complete